MKTQFAVALAVSTGFGLGALAVQGLHAQAKLPAYVVVDVTVSDEDNYQKELKGYQGEGSIYQFESQYTEDYAGNP